MAKPYVIEISDSSDEERDRDIIDLAPPVLARNKMPSFVPIDRAMDREASGAPLDINRGRTGVSRLPPPLPPREVKPVRKPVPLRLARRRTPPPPVESPPPVSALESKLAQSLAKFDGRAGVVQLVKPVLAAARPKERASVIQLAAEPVPLSPLESKFSRNQVSGDKRSVTPILTPGAAPDVGEPKPKKRATLKMVAGPGRSSGKIFGETEPFRAKTKNKQRSLLDGPESEPPISAFNEVTRRYLESSNDDGVKKTKPKVKFVETPADADDDVDEEELAKILFGLGSKLGQHAALAKIVDGEEELSLHVSPKDPKATLMGAAAAEDDGESLEEGEDEDETSESEADDGQDPDNYELDSDSEAAEDFEEDLENSDGSSVENEIEGEYDSSSGSSQYMSASEDEIIESSSNLYSGGKSEQKRPMHAGGGEVSHAMYALPTEPEIMDIDAPSPPPLPPREVDHFDDDEEPPPTKRKIVYIGGVDEEPPELPPKDDEDRLLAEKPKPREDGPARPPRQDGDNELLLARLTERGKSNPTPHRGSPKPWRNPAPRPAKPQRPVPPNRRMNFLIERIILPSDLMFTDLDAKVDELLTKVANFYKERVPNKVYTAKRRESDRTLLRYYMPRVQRKHRKNRVRFTTKKKEVLGRGPEKHTAGPSTNVLPGEHPTYVTADDLFQCNCPDDEWPLVLVGIMTDIDHRHKDDPTYTPAQRARTVKDLNKRRNVYVEACKERQRMLDARNLAKELAKPDYRSLSGSESEEELGRFLR
jgi:hypothetical protein